MKFAMCKHGRIIATNFFLPYVYWAVFGKTSAWVNENDPPDVDKETVAMTEVVFAKRFTIARQVFVGTLQDHDIVVDGTYWKIAYTLQSALANNARYLYLRFDVNKDEGPDVTYRQIGIFYNLVPTTGNEGKVLLLPNEIQSYGSLIWLNNRVAVDRNPAVQGEMLTYIIPF